MTNFSAGALIPAPPDPVPGPPPAPPVPPARSASGSWTTLVQWTAASAGLTGLLTILGFILNEASEDFWGYRFALFAGVPEYIKLSGELLFAGVTQTLQLVTGAGWVSVIVILSAAGLFFGTRRLGRRALARVTAHLAPARLLAYVAVVGALQLWLLQAPTFYVRDMLVDVGTQGLSTPSVGPARKLALLLQTHHVCSRISSANLTPEPTGAQPVEIPGAGVSCRFTDAPPYAVRLRHVFVANFLLSVLQLLALFALVRWLAAGEGAGWGTLSQGRRMGVASAASVFLLNVAALPYSYAKTARPTMVHEATVVVAGADGLFAATAGAVSAAAAVSGQIPPTPPTSSGPGMRSGFLLRGGDPLILYDAVERSVWLIPRDGVLLVRLENPKDFLQDHLVSRIKPAEAGKAAGDL